MAGHILPFVTGKAGERNGDKPGHSNVGQEVSGMLGKDHAILDRIQEMRKDEAIRQEERIQAFLERRLFPW
jgi:hypothetical protein